LRSKKAHPFHYPGKAFEGGREKVSAKTGYPFEFGIREILEAYGRRELSPVDLAKACIEQVERLEPALHVWEVFDVARLMDQALASERRLREGEPCRLLEGIPVGIKDIFNTRDFPTQMGSPLWKGFTPGNDARVVFNIREAGGVVPGKTVTAEFGVHAIGKTLNPHDPSRTPGTSSSGSAVAVAAGMVPVALGTQTGGSIVRPASFCGIYGYKPSFGLIPRTGILKTTDSLDTVGFFARLVRDLAWVFDVVRVRGDNYPKSDAVFQDRDRQNKPAGRPWKVALVRTHTWGHAEDYARESFLSWAEGLSKAEGIEVTEANLPPCMERAHEVHLTIYDKTLAYYFQEEYKRTELVSPIMNEIIGRGQGITAEQYRQALRDQEGLLGEMDRFLQSYDAMVSLSTAGEAPLREEREKPDPALMWTLTHLPVISAPVFVSPGGLPFGVQLIARKYNDLLLFKFADALRSRDLIPEGPRPGLGL
jgi:Asp-tRNA(Asn)/Glu-tRNA(Gln) amidotransferase A subunit family amidase